MVKRLAKYLFAMFALCFCFNIDVQAADEYNENYSYYTLSDYSVDGTYTLSFGLNHKKKIAAVTGFTEGEGFDGHVDIPSEVKFATDGVVEDTYTVVGVLKTAFRENKSLLSIKLPDTVTFLGVEAFKNCEYLEKVELGTGLEIVLDSCFAYCNSLSDINLNNTKVYELGQSSFFHCESLSNIDLPESLIDINSNCFEDCFNLQTLELPKNLKCFGFRCIADTSIKTLWIPKTLEHTGDALSSAPLLKSVTIEEGATTIFNYFFSDTNLDEINLPSTLTHIEDDAFRGATLPSNFVLPDGVTNIGASAFSRVNFPKEFKLPSSVKTIDAYAFSHTSFESDLILPEGLVSLEYSVFKGAKLYNSILQLPKSLKYIGHQCFSGCDVLEIVVNSDLEEGERCFETDTSIWWDDVNLIKKITLSNGVTKVPYGMFENSQIEEVVLPDTITTIDTNAFCKSSITKVHLGENITSIGSGAFKNSKLSGTVVIPNSVEVIKHDTFADCINLDSVVLGNKVTEIEYGAFMGSAIKKFVMPDSVESVDENAFLNCKYLKEITLSANLDKTSLINILGLTGCESLKKLEIPYGFSSLTDNKNVWDSLYIPESVTSIDDSFTSENVLKIVGVKGTYAETFATENNIPFEEGVAVQDFSFSNAVSELTMDEVFYVCISTTPRNIKDKVTWESSNPTIVSVSNDGELIALMPGVSTITVTIGDLSRSFDVKVLKPIEKIEMKPISIKTVGQKVKINYNVYPLDAEEHTYFDYPQNDYFDISEDGYILAKGEGSDYVYIRIKGTNNQEAIEWVTVGSGIEKPVLTIEDADNGETQSLSWGTISGYEGVEIHKYNEETGEWYLYKDLVGNKSGYTLKNFDVYADDISKVSNKFKVRYYVYDVNDEKLLGAFSEEVEYVPSEPEIEEPTTEETSRIEETTETATTEKPSIEETTEKPSVEETTEPIQDDTLKESEEMSSEEVTTEKQSESEKDSTTTKPSEEESTTEKPSEEETTSKEEETTEKPSEEETTSKEEETTEKPSEEETTSKVEETTSKEEETTEKPSEKPTEKPSEDNKDEVEKFKAQKIAVKVEKISNEYYLTWNKIDADGYNILVGNDTSYFSELVTVRDTKYKLPAKFVSDAFVLGIQGYKIIDGKVVYTNRSNIVAFEFKLTAAKNLKQKSTYTNKIEMSWGKVPNATGYEVWRATTKNSKYKRVATTTVNSLKQYVTGGSAYWYKVRACRVTSVGTVKYGDFSAPTKLYSKPSTPVITAKKAAGTKIKVSWEKSVGANCYDIYMSNSKSGTYRLVKTRKSTHNKYYTFTNLTRGKTYYFKIRTYKIDGSGNKIYSNWSTIKSVKLNK